MTKRSQTVATIDPQEASKIVDLLEKQASQTSNETVKRILLSAGCDIIDSVLAQEGAVAKAA